MINWICLALVFTVAVLVWLYESARDRMVKHQNYERQQLQSKIDTLTEYIVQQSGHPIDLNKRARDMFRSAVGRKDTAFKSGWQMDRPATVPGEKK